MNDYIPKSKRNGNGSGNKKRKEEKKNEGRLVSPNEMFKAAKDIMIEGREPTSQKDWMLIVNFFASNIQSELAQSAVPLLCKIYSIPLSEDTINKIIQFQLKHK